MCPTESCLYHTRIPCGPSLSGVTAQYVDIQDSRGYTYDGIRKFESLTCRDSFTRDDRSLCLTAVTPAEATSLDWVPRVRLLPPPTRPLEFVFCLVQGVVIEVRQHLLLLDSSAECLDLWAHKQHVLREIVRSLPAILSSGGAQVGQMVYKNEKRGERVLPWARVGVFTCNCL